MMRAGWSSKKTSFGLAKLYPAIKNTMDETLKTVVGATDTVFFATMTVGSDVGTKVFFSHTMVSIPAKMVFARQTIFLIRETMVPVARTIVSGFDPSVFVFHPMVSVSPTMVAGSPTMVDETD